MPELRHSCPTRPSSDLASAGRACASARGSRQALEVLGLWAGMAPAAAPILDIRISDGRAYETGLGSRRPGGASALHLHFSHEDLAEAEAGRPLGFIVENTAIRRTSLDRARALSGGPEIGRAHV